MTRFALGCAALLFFAACDDDDGGETTAAGSTGSATTDNSTTSGNGTTSTTDAPTTGGSSSGGGEGSSSSGGGEGSSSSGGGEESTGNPNACDPPVVGEYNACVDENGQQDNTLCNWMGTGQSVGIVGCLNGPTKGSNVCMIRDCVDACDCFNPPATGDAPVECREVIKGGGTACILNCGDGQTCPDGMTCDNGICWHGL